MKTPTRIRLGDAGRWLSGGTPSKNDPALWRGPLPWVSPKDMKRVRLADSIDHVADDAVGRGTQLAPAGSVLLVVRGMILVHTVPVAIVTRQVAFNQDIKALVPRQDLLADFVLCWFLLNQRAVLDLVDTSQHGTKRLPTEKLFDLTIPLPRLGVQRAFAEETSELLDAFDASISGAELAVSEMRLAKKACLADLAVRLDEV